MPLIKTRRRGWNYKVNSNFQAIEKTYIQYYTFGTKTIVDFGFEGTRVVIFQRDN